MKLWVWNSILIILSVLTSCHSTKKLIDQPPPSSTIVFDKIIPDSIYNRIRHNQDVPFITAKGHVTFSNPDGELEGSITLYVIRDSVYLAIIKKLGIELSRILLTKDSFKILDRINQSYSANSIDEFIQKNKIPIDFSGIHQILTSACFLNADIFYEFVKTLHECSLYGTSEYETLTYQLDTLRLLPRSFEAKYEHYSLQVDVQKSKNVSGKWIPVQFGLIINDPVNQILNIHINWDDVKLDPISSIKFIIPEHYTKVSE